MNKGRTGLARIALALVIAATAWTGCSSKPATESGTPTTPAAATLVPGRGLPAQVKIGIGTIADHPALNAAIDGFKDRLVKAGYVEGTTLRIDVRNAQGSSTNAVTIADGFAGGDANLFLAVGTTLAQKISDKERRRPILFVAVTDPVGDKIVPNLTAPGGRITGTSDMNPVADQFDLIRQLQPNVKRVGILYNPGETNSVALLVKAKQAASDRGLVLTEGTAINTGGVSEAVNSLMGKVDAVYMPTDNTMATAITVIIDACAKGKVPFYSSETESVRTGGAVAALAVDYRALGGLTGDMALQVLGGKSPGSIGVTVPKTFELHLNESAAKRLGLTIPEATRARATKVIG